MSELADQERTKRQLRAAPGGRHDRLVRLLRVLLPSIIGALLAILAFSPFSSTRELSFVLDKKQVNMAQERMRITKALYRGEDGKGRPFSLSAGSAVQKSSAEPVIKMSDLSGRIMMADGPASLLAGDGQYDMQKETVRVIGPMSLSAQNGYSLTASNVELGMQTQILRSVGKVSLIADGYQVASSNVEVNLPGRRLQSFGPVSGSTKVGSFSANRLQADLNARTVTLSGGAHLRIDQNAIR
jgi:lipopolysaccharide export system protein LptC